MQVIISFRKCKPRSKFFTSSNIVYNYTQRKVISRGKEWWFCSMDSENYSLTMVSSIWNGTCGHKGEGSVSLQSWMIPSTQHNPLVPMPSSSICSNWTSLIHFSLTHIPLFAALLCLFFYPPPPHTLCCFAW